MDALEVVIVSLGAAAAALLVYVFVKFVALRFVPLRWAMLIAAGAVVTAAVAAFEALELGGLVALAAGVIALGIDMRGLPGRE